MFPLLYQQHWEKDRIHKVDNGKEIYAKDMKILFYKYFKMNSAKNSYVETYNCSAQENLMKGDSKMPR